jgi:hypothetical protein
MSTTPVDLVRERLEEGVSTPGMPLPPCHPHSPT